MAAPLQVVAGSQEDSKCDSLHPIYDHPKYREMQSFGLEDEDHLRLALHVYLDLTESKSWWNVRVVPCTDLQKVVICGFPSPTEPEEVVLPLHTTEHVSLSRLRSFLTHTGSQAKSVILALTDSGSNIVHYRITDGLVPPESPEMMEAKKRKRHLKFQRRYSRFVRLSQVSKGGSQPHSWAGTTRATHQRMKQKSFKRKEQSHDRGIMHRTNQPSTSHSSSNSGVRYKSGTNGKTNIPETSTGKTKEESMEVNTDSANSNPRKKECNIEYRVSHTAEQNFASDGTLALDTNTSDSNLGTEMDAELPSSSHTGLLLPEDVSDTPSNEEDCSEL